MNVVLFEPEIPHNTGNIGRTCVATGCALHLIEPLGFQLTDKYLKRAGMDYWDKLSLTRYIDYNDFCEKNADKNIWYISTKGKLCYTDAEFRSDDYIMFGSESSGIPDEILAQHLDRCLRIPMLDDIRSLNLSNSVAIVVYEALRQQDFAGLSRTPRRELRV